MKLLHYLSRPTAFLPFIFFSTISLSQSAIANLQFTYTTQELPFKQGYLEDIPDDSVGSNEPPYPAFSVSFTTAENNLTSNFLTGDLTIGLAPGYSILLNNIPATSSNIKLSEDGSVAAWHFALALTQTTPATLDNPPDRTGWFVESSHGANTCNCDWFKYDFDLYIQRPYDQWAYVNTLGFLYGDVNTPDNWTIAKVNVPEPPSPLLLLAGIAIIGLVRLRKSVIL